MESGNSAVRQAQLDKAEREHLEGVVTELRELVEREIEYELEHQYDLTEREGGGNLSEAAEATRDDLVAAIEHENPGGKSWEWCYEQYVNGVGYTFINRLAALRCMEVRGFIEQPVTRIGESGLTPAAEQVLAERFDVGRNESLVVAFEDATERFDDEIELLFDTNSPYTVLDIDPDLFEEAVTTLDDVPAAVWRADDVLGWVYEYYNVGLLDDLRRKGDREGLEPEDVPAANQFYTPHWVVRMLTDNSLGKLYLEHTGEFQDVVAEQEGLSPDERKNRPLSPDESPDIADFCTYLVPSEEDGEPTEFDHPRELRVIDPACGSGHFLLYAFDVLERIWRAETELDEAEIPRRVLEHNLHGVDLDMRACQLAAFNLYLKGRTRAEAEGAAGFDMPEVGIVCADATVAEVEGVEEVFDEVAGDDEEVEAALRTILDAFEEVHGLGSLLDVRGTLGDLFEDDADIGGTQLTLGDDPREDHTLGQVLHSLREAVAEHRDEDSFLAQDLRSFVRLLDLLAQDYDVALMNPPYGARNRMPENIREYVRDRLSYPPEFYINFFEVCDRVTTDGGRIGMLVPWSFMFKNTFEQFRTDFVGERGGFDFLCEFGYDILDNAMVGTVGTVVRTGTEAGDTGTFIRLHDLDAREKEGEYLSTISNADGSDVRRFFEVPLRTFERIPRTPICYSIPEEVLRLHETELKLDADSARVDGRSVGNAANGMNTGDNDRFLTNHWAADESFKPYAKGGSDAWIIPTSNIMINWGDDGTEVRRFPGSVIKNAELYGQRGLTWTYAKRTGRRYGYFPGGGAFDGKGSMYFPDDVSIWLMMGVLNSSLYHNLFLSLTPERDWQIGDVGRIPWRRELESEEIRDLAKEQFRVMLGDSTQDPVSQYYAGPKLLPEAAVSEFFYDHPHTEEYLISDLESEQYDSIDPAEPIRRIARTANQNELVRRRRLEELSDEIDAAVYDRLDIPEQVREYIEQEIFLRTAEEPEDREVPDPQSVPELPENIDRQVKDLVHHFAMEAVQAESDGIVPVQPVDGKADVLDRIVERFEDAYGEHAEDRLVEVDEVLGTESAADEAYPNLRAFIEGGLFEYHVDRMENTPILWKLSTERLVADPAGDGFACFVDYHQLDTGLFDRLTTQYLDPRKEELRNRQSTANRRRNDESLPTTERSDAADTFERTTNMLDQIAELEGVMQELGSRSDREFSEEARTAAAELAPKVAAFRAETESRLDALAEVRERRGNGWFQDTFSDGFWEKVQEWSDEWLDALDDLEHACEVYAEPTDQPVEAHLADLFDYFDWRLKGSDHYSSTGVLFMTYYFEREGSDLLDEDGEPHGHLTEDEQLLASLATGLDDPSILDTGYIDEVWEPDGGDLDAEPPAIAEYKALAEEIDDRCRAIGEEIPDDWAERALSEVTTAGYQPTHKHGVAINVTPLAEQEIVPKTVEEDVL